MEKRRHGEKKKRPACRDGEARRELRNTNAFGERWTVTLNFRTKKKGIVVPE